MSKNSSRWRAAQNPKLVSKKGGWGPPVWQVWSVYSVAKLFGIVFEVLQFSRKLCQKFDNCSYWFRLKLCTRQALYLSYLLKKKKRNFGKKAANVPEQVPACPFPEYPRLHWQAYEPNAFVQVAFLSHKWTTPKHSSMSKSWTLKEKSKIHMNKILLSELFCGKSFRKHD